MPDVDAVELRACHGDPVEPDARRVLDVDPVLAADHRDVAYGHAARADDDAAADDRARLADEHLPSRDHDRPLVDARREMHDRRAERICSRARAGERRPDEDRCRQAQPAELAPVLGVAEPQQRQPGVAE